MSNRLDMKQSNVQTVLWTLYSYKAATVKDLTESTGLSYATVGYILGSLVETQEVSLGKLVSATGGRPSQTYIFNEEYAHILALSARFRNGKNVISACVGNLYGKVVWQTEQTFENIQLSSFESMIDPVLRAYPSICILSFSLPGVERYGVIVANDYTELVGLHFTDHFLKKYGLTALVENDVNAAVLGYGKTVDPTSVLAGIYFPKHFGPGAGILVDGKILKGAGGYAGEVCLLPLGIDWLSIDYGNPRQIVPAISRLVSVFCSIVNPNHVVLYGDFFSDGLMKAIPKEIQSKTILDIFPSIDYTSDLDADIIAGLFVQAISAYQSGLRKKS